MAKHQIVEKIDKVLFEDGHSPKSIFVDLGEVSLSIVSKDLRTHRLGEAKEVDLGAGMKINIHPAHGGQGKPHFHCLQRGNKLYAMNFDGTNHDNSKGVRLHNRVIDYIKDKMPQVTLPKDGVIEQLLVDQAKQLLFG